jgi:hypothetical protein
MRIILFTCAILFFAACSKEEQNTADVNLNIYGPTLQSFEYKLKVDGIEKESIFIEKGGYARYWFGSKPNNITYSVEFTKKEKYDTGYVDFIWRNGDKGVLSTSRFYMDTLTFNFENSVRF